MNLAARSIAAALLVFSAALPATVPRLPELGDAQRVGAGALTWFGMTVYQASLFAADGVYQADRPHALRIDYRFGFSAQQLASRSLEEIERIHGRQPERDALLVRLRSVMRDVAPGEHLTAIHYPGRGAEFYSAGELLGRLENAELAAKFFTIWLAPETREPRLRDQLLGGSR